MTTKINHFLTSFLLLLSIMIFPKYLFAETKASIGSISNVLGKVEIIRDGKSIKAEKGASIFEVDSLVTHENSAVKLNFQDGSNFMAFQNSTFKVSEYKLKSNQKGGTNLKSTMDIVKGSVRFFVKPKDDGANDSKFATPNSVMAIRGTSVGAEITPQKTSVSVLKGSVEFSNKSNPNLSVLIPTNMTSSIAGNLAPSKPSITPPSVLANINQQAEKVDPGYKDAETPKINTKDDQSKSNSESENKDEKNAEQGDNNKDEKNAEQGDNNKNEKNAEQGDNNKNEKNAEQGDNNKNDNNKQKEGNKSDQKNSENSNTGNKEPLGAQNPNGKENSSSSSGPAVFNPDGSSNQSPSHSGNGNKKPLGPNPAANNAASQAAQVQQTISRTVAPVNGAVNNTISNAISTKNIKINIIPPKP